MVDLNTATFVLASGADAWWNQVGEGSNALEARRKILVDAHPQCRAMCTSARCHSQSTKYLLVLLIDTHIVSRILDIHVSMNAANLDPCQGSGCLPSCVSGVNVDRMMSPEIVASTSCLGFHSIPTI